MIKFRVREDEWYPVYMVDSYEKSTNTEVEMSQKDFHDWKKVEEQFQYWQDRVWDLRYEARKNKK
jgi:hypothetical protein